MMRRFLAATALAGSILLAAAVPAAADSGDYYADGRTSVDRGTGSASVFDLEADAAGELSAGAEAVGGTKFLVSFLNMSPYSNESRAFAEAYVSGGVEITDGPGVYELTVTFENAVADEAEAGAGSARGEAWVGIVGSGAGGYSTYVASASEELPSAAGTVVVRVEIEVTSEAGELGFTAALRSTATATGADNEASTLSSGQVAEVTAELIG